MSYRVINQCKDLVGKRVLVRTDFNVSIENDIIRDDTKILAAIPTIKYLIQQKAKVILMSHLGRPEGVATKEFRLEPVAVHLEKKLRKRVYMAAGLIGNEVIAEIDRLKNGQVILLENTRFHPDEKNNQGTLGKDLAALADIFVLDGFGVVHRGDASVVGPAKYIPSYAGLLLDTEISGLSKVMDNPASPFVLVIGGIKMETKIPVVKKFLKSSDQIIIGGGLYNTFLKALGYEIGASVYDEDFLDIALKLFKNKKIELPVDVVVGTKTGKKTRVVLINETHKKICTAAEAIQDIGPESIKKFQSIIKTARTIVNNGAMGYFELSPYDIGTRAITKEIIKQSKAGAYTVIGGGETVAVYDETVGHNSINLVSTGGGAMLEFLSGKKLPGIKVLEKWI